MQRISFKSRLKQLSIDKKLIGLGAAIMSISVFLPWYKDLDRFNTGDTFLGVTGPLYLAGLIVLAASVMSFMLIALRFIERPLPKLPLKESHFHLFTAGLSIFMLILTNSVYYHVKFGINLTDKNMGAGMMMTFGGVAILLIGAVWSSRSGNVNLVQSHMQQMEEFGESLTQKRSREVRSEVEEVEAQIVTEEPVSKPEEPRQDLPRRDILDQRREESMGQTLRSEPLKNERQHQPPLRAGRSAEAYSGNIDFVQNGPGGAKNFFGGGGERGFTRKIKIEDKTSGPITIEDKLRQYQNLNNEGNE